MFTVDCHTHTRFFHALRGRPTPYDRVGAELLVRFARWRDLDGVVLTNHDYYCSFDGIADRPQLIPGIEISTTAGHVLVIGSDPPSRTRPGELTPQEAVELAHERDCVAVIAHPFRNSTVRNDPASFDAVEINGKHPQVAERVRTLATEREIPVVGGSDAHFPFEIGRAATRVDADTLTPESVVAAIRDGRVEPTLNTGISYRLIKQGYRYLHRFRGHVTPAED